MQRILILSLAAEEPARRIIIVTRMKMRNYVEDPPDNFKCLVRRNGPAGSSSDAASVVKAQ